MKTLALALIALSPSAFATSYWYDYCDATKPALEHLREKNAGVDIGPDKRCSRTSYVFAETSACTQTIQSVTWFSTRASYKVAIQTENDGVYHYSVKFKSGNSELCKLTKLSFLSKSN